MRHGKKSKQLGRIAKQRKALTKALAVALVEHGRIKTTLPKAKFLKPYIEKIITKAKEADLGAVRTLRKEFNPKSLKIVVEQWAPLFKDRKGGYTRIIKLNPRTSDASPMAYLEFVEKPTEKNKEGVMKPSSAEASAGKQVQNDKKSKILKPASVDDKKVKKVKVANK